MDLHGILREYCYLTMLNLIFILISGYLHLGYSTPFLSIGASFMYSSLAAAKAAVIAVGEEIATLGLPCGISPVVFVFTGTGNGNLIKTKLLCYYSALAQNYAFHMLIFDRKLER